MATLQKIRNRAGLLIIVVGGALLAFIIGDGLRSGSSFMQFSKNVAMTIDGERVPIEDFSRALHSRQKMAEQFGNRLTDEQRAYVSNQLASEYVEDYVLGKEAEALGIRVTGAELSALIYGKGVSASPMALQFFQQVGIDPSDSEGISNLLAQLDPKQIQALPAEQQELFYMMHDQWNTITKSILRERLKQKFGALMSRSYAINKIDAKYMAPTNTREVLVVRTPSTIMEDKEVAVSDADLKKYYDSHKENFKRQMDETILRYISVEIRPSAADYAAAQKKMEEARAQLAATTDAASVARNYDEQFTPKTYFSASELGDLRLDDASVSFIKSAPVGDVYASALENDRYSLIKLCAKKTAPETVKIGVIVLDSVNVVRADSIVAAINSGASFEEMVKNYSMDPETKSKNGFLEYNDPRTGIPTQGFTENIAMQSGLDTLFRTPIGQAIVLNKNLIVRASEPAASVEKYQIAFVGIRADFSKETSDQRYSEINNIFSSTKDFDQMVKTAREKGINVVEDLHVNSYSPSLGAIPSSREVIGWALGAEKGAIHDRIFRCGDNHLLIAQVTGKIEAGYVPFDMVKEDVKDLVMVEKRGEALANKLATAKYSTLTQYAEAMNSSVDTLSSVTAQVTGMMHSAFTGYAMNQALNTLSAPFVAGTEVMVVMPVQEQKSQEVVTLESPIIMQQERALSQQMASRAMRKLSTQVIIKDNRYRFNQ